jgi:FG-GAP repeat
MPRPGWPAAVALLVLLTLIPAGVATASGPGMSAPPFHSNPATLARVAGHFSPIQITTPNAQKDGAFGTSVAISGATVVVGAPGDKVSGYKDAGHAYIVNTSTGYVMTLTSPNAQPKGAFGTSVAIEGSTVVVGAPFESPQGLYSGAAYVYSALNGALQFSLISPHGEKGAIFGGAVAIGGSTIVVGSAGENVSKLGGAGQAYAFSAVTGKSLVTLTSPNRQLNGAFGGSVVTTGTTVVVGAPNEAIGMDGYAGRAYVFDVPNGTLVTTLTSPHPTAYGSFGMSVGISGSTVVVGTYGETASGLADAGHVYTFDAATGSVVSTLTSPNAQLNGGFGWSVGISGKLVVVGAARESSSGLTFAGNAYSFLAPNSDSINGSFTTPNAVAYGGYGDSIAVSGSTLVVGAPGETAANDSGAGNVYVFSDSPLTVTSPSPQASENFGLSVAISGTTVVVGAPYQSADGDAGAGHAYIISTTTGLIRKLTSPNAQSNGSFGFSVAVDDSTVVVGAFDESAGGHTAAGHAYSFNVKTGAFIATLTSLHPQASGNFGASVSVSGSTVVVGAPFENASGDVDAGHAYAFSASTGAVLFSLASPNPQSYGLFGYSVGLSGTTLAVGAPLEKSSGLDSAGRAYLFDSGTGAFTFGLKSSHAQAGGDFGASVAASGATVVVGAPYENASGLADAGRAYAFNASSGVRILSLVSPDAQPYGEFGFSVGLNATSILVGAPAEPAALQVGVGNAYTFNRTTGVQMGYYTSADPQDDGFFGGAVALGSSTVVVGAPFESAWGQASAGHCYFFA